jgi:hypothetical protein
VNTTSRRSAGNRGEDLSTGQLPARGPLTRQDTSAGYNGWFFLFAFPSIRQKSKNKKKREAALKGFKYGIYHRNTKTQNITKMLVINGITF